MQYDFFSTTHSLTILYLSVNQKNLAEQYHSICYAVNTLKCLQSTYTLFRKRRLALNFLTYKNTSKFAVYLKKPQVC